MTELSRFIVLLLAFFLMVGSGVLLWDGLAARVSHHARDAALQGHEHAAGRLVTGALGVAIAAWILLGMLTHAR